MNAQISRKRIISLQIILNILLIVLCYSSCIECLGVFSKQDILHHRQQHQFKTPHDMLNRSEKILTENILYDGNFHASKVTPYESHPSHERLMPDEEKPKADVAAHFHNSHKNINKRWTNSSKGKNKIMRGRKYERNINRRFLMNDKKSLIQSDINIFNRPKIKNKSEVPNEITKSKLATAQLNEIHSSTMSAFEENYSDRSNLTFHNKISHHRLSNNREEIMRDESTDGVYDKMPIINYDNIRNRRESSGDVHHHKQQLHYHQPILRFLPSRNSNNNRQKRKKYCSARDPKTLAFEAPTVFEGKIKSMTSDRQANFSATLEILKVHKRQPGFALPRQVRLQFAYRNSSECDIYREEFRHRGFVRDELEQGKVYYLFVKQISLGNFTILGQPVRKNNRTLHEVADGVSEKYGKQASIDSITPDVTVKEGRKVRIVCKISGEPSPKVTWFKDGKSISRNRLKYDFVYLRRRSDLIIKAAQKSDNGVYECRAKNKLTNKRRPVSQSMRLDVIYYGDGSDHRTTGNFNGAEFIECPPEYLLFCEHGGKCLFLESLREPTCRCPDGYGGTTCENKTPNITASAYSNLLDNCSQGNDGSFFCRF